MELSVGFRPSQLSAGSAHTCTVADPDGCLGTGGALRFATPQPVLLLEET